MFIGEERKGREVQQRAGSKFMGLRMGEILGRSLIRKQVSLLCKSGIEEKSVSQFLSSVLLRENV